MNTKFIIHILNATAKLLSLHGANPFQVKHYTNAALFLDRLEIDVASLNKEELNHIEGINKSLITLIEEIQTTGTLRRWEELSAKTPEGVLKMLELPGLGPKKVSMLWQELGVQTLEELEEACKLGKVAQLAGFGEKTQASILESLVQHQDYQGKLHYATALVYANKLELAFKEKFPDLLCASVGEFRRRLEIISDLVWLVATNHPEHITEWLSTYPDIKQIEAISGPFAWRGYFIDNQLPVSMLFCEQEEFYKQLIIQTGSAQHLTIELSNGKSLGQVISQAAKVTSEADGYEQAGLPYIPVELREGIIEKSWIELGVPKLLQLGDLKGVFHIHTKYSDGQNSLESMAAYCKALGYSYIGITDHSQSAAYAGGLRAHTVQQQHDAIDALNKELAPFKIYKGIESDVLPDGSLDYPYDILSKFDFIIASIHMGLNMSQQKATERLIAAISNPFTTMLGHPTGRLLLKREGYPIDHEAVIDACAAHGVVIEINANPWRLDLDWRWVSYAIKKGVKLSINPDAHHQDEIFNMRYGVYMGRKGGLTQEHTFNALSQEEMERYLKKRKEVALQAIASL